MSRPYRVGSLLRTLYCHDAKNWEIPRDLFKIRKWSILIYRDVRATTWSTLKIILEDRRALFYRHLFKPDGLTTAAVNHSFSIS